MSSTESPSRRGRDTPKRGSPARGGYTPPKNQSPSRGGRGGTTPSPHRGGHYGKYKQQHQWKNDRREPFEWSGVNKLTLNMEEKVFDLPRLQKCLERVSTELSTRKLKNKPLKLNVKFAKNNLTDAGITYIVDYLLNNKNTIHLKKMYLHKNRITDEGAKELSRLIRGCDYAIDEIHLSHNYITCLGAISIIDAVSQCKMYPRGEQSHADEEQREEGEDEELVDKMKNGQTIVPLWLRLEWNCIDYASVVTHMTQNKIHHCNAESGDERDDNDFRKKQCAPWDPCYNGKDTVVHLYCLDLQFEVEGEAEEPQAGVQLTSTPSSSMTGPILLLLDTNAVMSMLNSRDCTECGRDTRNGEQSVRHFTFDNIISRHTKSMANDSNYKPHFVLCICTTVRTELDHRKKVMPSMRHCLMRITSDELGGQFLLTSMVRSGLIVLPKSLQAEMALLSSSSSQVIDFSSARDANTQNDIKLINVAAYYRKRGRNAIILSNDKAVISMSRTHGVPVESLKSFDKLIGKLKSNEEWDGDIISSCLSKASVDIMGNEMSPSPNDSKSLFDHITDASDMMTKLSRSHSILSSTLASMRETLERGGSQEQLREILEKMDSNVLNKEKVEEECAQLVSEWSNVMKRSDPFSSHT
ncbi:hypothetical protein PROFUN_05105 [Planoprotostelium fungivorum]|uniref:PIN domain-containing protein n=1 Tax=Planoprotostelium fungivorum TaxID=1890364 RepID=A0A2P6NRP2_9EUKA|nr:hypothetical protein PROFUN_05105 [Planoprotostelium fungivorum]